MNYLAHLYLSDSDDQLLIGNFIADAVKGKSYKEYPTGIANGIILHRAIDTFMDTHPIVKQGTKRLHANYGKFASVIIDIYYDHFLATYWHQFSDLSLADFASASYETIEKYKNILPGKMPDLLFYMKRDNWLLSYNRPKGIQSVLQRMSNRIKIQENFHESYFDLIKYYTKYEEEFLEFFPLIMEHCEELRASFKIQR